MTSNTANNSSVVNLFLFWEQPQTSAILRNNDHAINLAPSTAVTAVTSPNWQHGRGMHYLACDNTDASQGGYTEACPPPKWQQTITTQRNRHVCQRRTPGLKEVVQFDQPRQRHDEDAQQKQRCPPKRDLGNQVQSCHHHCDRPGEVAAATAALGPGAARISMTITTRTEAQGKANRLNLNFQAIIGAK